MVWVDTHCHLQLDGRPPRELLERATDVDWLVAPGVDAASSEASAELAARHPGRILATAGLHPHDAGRWPDEEPRIVELAGAAAAIGETGLDHYRDLAPREAQRLSFRAQLDLARALGKPVIVHCRDAFAEVHEMLAEADLAGGAVLHCWTGGPRWSRRFSELDVTFSFAGPVAFETGDTIRRGADVIHPDRVMVETDTPYLAPPPYRGQRNEPAWVALVGRALAEVWGMDVAQVAASTSARARAVFGVDP